MKRFLLGAATGAILISASASQALAGDSSAPVLDKIMKRGELIVAMTGDQPPLNATNKKGELIGLEVELARTLGASMGVKTKIVTKPFPELLPALEAGKVDMVISGITITPQRNAKVLFAGPYFISGKSLLTKSEKLADAEDAAEINADNVRLAALGGSTSEQFVNDAIPKAKLTVVDSYDEAIKLLKKDEVDGLVAGFPYCVVAALRGEADGLDTLAEPFTYEPIGIALPGNDPRLANLVQNFLNTMRGSGALLELKAGWFLDSSWLDELK